MNLRNHTAEYEVDEPVPSLTHTGRKCHTAQLSPGFADARRQDPKPPAARLRLTFGVAAKAREFDLVRVRETMRSQQEVPSA